MIDMHCACGMVLSQSYLVMIQRRFDCPNVRLSSIVQKGQLV